MLKPSIPIKHNYFPKTCIYEKKSQKTSSLNLLNCYPSQLKAQKITEEYILQTKTHRWRKASYFAAGFMNG